MNREQTLHASKAEYLTCVIRLDRRGEEYDGLASQGLLNPDKALAEAIATTRALVKFKRACRDAYAEEGHTTAAARYDQEAEVLISQISNLTS